MTQEPARGVDASLPTQAAEAADFRPAEVTAEAPGVSAPRATEETVAAKPRKPRASDLWLAQVLIAIATLAMVGASLMLTYHQLVLPEVMFQKHLGSNQLDRISRSGILVAVLAGAGFPALAALLAVLLRRESGSRLVVRLGELLGPLALLWTLPSLLAHRIWYNAPLGYLIFLSAVLLGGERLFRRSFAAFPRSTPLQRISDKAAHRIALAVVTFAAIGYTVYTGYFSILEHRRLATSAYDLGIYDNLISNNLAGKFFRNPVLGPGLNYLSNHAEFGTILIAPIYALRPDSTTLLALQSFALGFAAIPLYLFASTQLPRASSALIAVGYLLYAPLHGPNFYDFHWMPMALPLWFGLFYAIILRKKWLIALTIVLLLTIREEIGVMLAVLGVFMALSGYWVRLGVLLAALGTFTFATLKFVIMPLAGTWWFSGMYAELIAPGEEGFVSVVRTLIVNPNYVWKTLATEQKLVYFLHLMAPLAFLPFRRPLLVFLAIPGFFFTLLTTSYEPTLSIRFQYTSHWIPWVFGASVLALKVLTVANGVVYRRAAIATLAVGLFVHSYVYGAVLQRETFVGGFHKVSFGMTEEERARYATLRRMIGRIPKQASVAATETECPHIANRVDAYTLRVAHGDSDFILLRRGMVGPDERRNLTAAMTAHEYGLIDGENDLYLFKRGHHAPKETRAALRKVGVTLGSGKTYSGFQDEK